MANIILIIFLFSLTGCGLDSDHREPNQTPISAQRCGDRVCDGPENQKNCPEDCSENISMTNEKLTEDEQASQVEGDDAQGESQCDVSSDLIAENFIEVSVMRSDGVGSCGVEPWGVDHIEGGDYSCPPPKYWFGYDLEATIQQQVDLIPQGQGWIFSARSNGGGAYQKALRWSAGM